MKSFTVWPAACWNRLIRGWVFFCRDIREGKLMKKAIIAVFMLSGIFLSWGYGQHTSQDKAEFERIKAEFEQNKNAWADKQAKKLIAFAEKIKDDQYSLNGALRDLDDSLITNYMSPEVAKDITRRLTKIYYTLDEQPTNRANKNRIIEIIGLSDNSLDAHEFFLKILQNGPDKYRREALSKIYFGNLHGDDIYDKVKSLADSGVIEKTLSLAALKGANKKRALSEIEEYMKTVDNLKDFIQIGLLLCEYKDSDAMDVVIDRYDYFKSKPIPPEYAKEMYSPSRAITYKMLEKYMTVKEGKRLEKAIEIYEGKNVFDDKVLPIFERKLESKDIITRRAIVKFLGNKSNLHSCKIEAVKKVLQEAESKERDKNLKNQLKAILNDWEK